VSSLRHVSPAELARVNAVLERARRPITRPELASMTGLPDRAVRAAIAELVLAGEPILSVRENGGGYWYCSDRERVKAEILLLASHEARIRERRHALERHLEREQGNLFAETA
jgi:hypothetical protein